MATKKTRVRRKEAGFIGANISGAGGDLTLYNRLVEEKKKTTMSHSLIIRLALTKYFEEIDNK